MIKHKRAFYADDEEYEILKAAAKRRSVSEYVLSCAMGAAKRHTPVEELRALIQRIVREEIGMTMRAKTVTEAKSRC